MSLPPILRNLAASLKHASHQTMSVTIGGGTYTPAEMRDAAEALDHLDIITDAAPRLPNTPGRKPQKIACTACDATIEGSSHARRIGWIVTKYRRGALCPDCQRASRR